MALSAGIDLPQRIGTELLRLPVAASTTVYKGGFISLSDAGYAIPLTYGKAFMGIAYETVDNSAGAAAAKYVRVSSVGDFEITLTSAAITDIGKPVYATDDATIGLTSNAGGVNIGRVVGYENANKAFIRILPNFQTLPNGMLAGMVELDCETGTTPTNVLIIPGCLNPNGMYVHNAYAIVTEVFGGASEDQGVVTLKDSADTSLVVTFTATNAAADAAGDVIQNAGTNKTAVGGASGDPVAIVAAGKGLKAGVTQNTSGAGAAGKFRVVVQCFPY